MITCGIDPGLKGKAEIFAVSRIVHGAVITSREKLSMAEAVEFCAGAGLVVVETPDTRYIPAVRANNVAKTIKAAMRIAGELTRAGLTVKQYSAEEIRTATVGKIPTKERNIMTGKLEPVTADTYILERWLIPVHLILERRFKGDVRMALLKSGTGALSNNHKRDAYLAALCGERLLINRRLAVEMGGQ